MVRLSTFNSRIATPYRWSFRTIAGRSIEAVFVSHLQACKEHADDERRNGQRRAAVPYVIKEPDKKVISYSLPFGLFPKQ